MTVLEQMALKIIREQELIIGPLAWTEAQKVSGLSANLSNKEAVSITAPDAKETVNRLVAQYERLFGRASHETCREAVASILAELSPADTPTSLLAV